MNTHEALIGAHMLIQMLPQKLFKQAKLRALAKLNESEIMRIACARITTCHFLSSQLYRS